MGTRGVKLDRTALTFFGYCMLILAISVICFQIKNKDQIEAFEYSSFENCAMYIKQNSKQTSHLEFADMLDQKILAKKIYIEDVPELKSECSEIVHNIKDRLISERLIIYQYDL